MEKHAPDSCPRCGEIFTCKANAILKCDCMNIQLTKAETASIRNISLWEFDGACVCVKCLMEMKEIVRLTQ